jgi:outer membrane protein OmpA-like peptidoglycan-associated protein
MKIILSITLIFCLSLSINAQNLSKEGKQNAKIAFEYYQTEDYYSALEYYHKVELSDPDNIGIQYSIAASYVRSFQAEKALPYLNKVKNSSDKKIKNDPLLNYYFGVAYHVNHQFDEAITNYNLYLQNLVNEVERKKIEHYIHQCNTAKKLVSHPIDIKVHNLGSEVNTIYDEYNPVITADEHMMYFTSRRENSTGGLFDERDKMYFEDIYVAERITSNHSWGHVKHLNGSVNSESHDACIGLSPDGQQMFVYKTENGGDIFTTRLKGEIWSLPSVISDNINSLYYEPGVTVSSDGLFVIFVSDRPGGFGGTDLYLSKKNHDGTFTNPINMGPNVNSIYNENSPFLHNDGKTLSFSSEGFEGMGGYDVFKIAFDHDKGEVIGQPMNEGYPINTAGDEIFFVWSADNRRAYFSSSREGGYGNKDIYYLELPEADAKVVVYTGDVMNCETKTPLEGLITITDNETANQIGTYTSNSSTGKFVVVLPAGKNYGLTVEAKDYAFYSKNVDIPNLRNFREVEENICMQSVEVGTKLVLRNVFFDVNQATLRNESQVELDKLVDVLNQNPKSKIQISGHTDADGEELTNLNLSKERAKAVYDYLISKNIKADRLSYVGFGESKPFTTNDTEEHKQLNRRTEIEFVK